MNITVQQAMKMKAEAERMMQEALDALAAARFRPEGELVSAINDIDDQITELQNQRYDLEVELLKGLVVRGKLNAVTFREASMLTGFTEGSLRAKANPKKNDLVLVKEEGEMSKITIESLRPYIKD